jgi:hypothetical protein
MLRNRYVGLLSQPPNNGDVDMFLTQLKKALIKVEGPKNDRYN